MTHSNSLRTGRLRTASVCVALLTVVTALVVGTPDLGGGVGPSAGAATASASASTGHCPSGSAPGITSGQVKVAASIIDVSSGSLTNATVGVPSTKQQEADYNLVAKKINSEGGAGCRKIVMSFYDVNPVDAANAQQSCLSIASAQPYIVLDSGALTEVGAASCIPQHHILLASSYLTPDDLTVYHPYALAIGGTRRRHSAPGSWRCTDSGTSAQPRGSRSSACCTTRAPREPRASSNRHSPQRKSLLVLWTTSAWDVPQVRRTPLHPWSRRFSRSRTPR